jgi:glycerol-3-phosphate O-acyltransferase
MAESARTAAPNSEPPGLSWPVPIGGRVLFLLDAASRLEERILHEWIDRERPDRHDRAAVETIVLPSSRRPRRSKLGPLEAALAVEEEALLVPLRVAWLPPVRDGGRAVRLWHALLLGDPRDPGPVRASWIARRHPDRCRVVVAEPATVSELRDRWQRAVGLHVAETMGLDRFVARQAALALERSERRLRGARYKVPRFLREDLLERPAFQGGLARIAGEEGRPLASVQRTARRALKEIAATHAPLMIDIFAAFCRSSSTRGYDELRVDPVQIGRLREIAAQSPVVFLPTHKSNLDHPVLRRVLHEAGMPPNHTAGGDNMNFFPAGPIARRAGIFFIRRSFKDDEVYKFVLRSYIDFLIEKRFPLEWYIEGGRSRSGKLLPPRFGLLSYVVDAYRRGRSDDVVLVPVSVAYDQISEVGDYAREEQGGAKQTESFRWLITFLRRLGRKYGSIDLRFGEPLSLRDVLGEAERPAEGMDGEIGTRKLAFEVCARINRVTPITPISLAMLAMLGCGDRAMSVDEIQADLADLVGYVTRRGLPTSGKLVFESTDDVCRTLDLLVESGVLRRFDGGAEVIFSVAPDAHLSAAYYRNTVIHHLLNGAIGEVALIAASSAQPGEGERVFWHEAMGLRDLLKFDFFFSEKEQFRSEVRAELRLHDHDWERRLGDPASTRRLIDAIRPFHAHRTLRAFLEAYAIVADRLVTLEGAAVEDRAALADECMKWGRQYALQRRIRSAESVSRNLLANGLRLAENRGLLHGGSRALISGREQLSSELRTAIRRVDAIDALDSARRAGALA